MDQITFYLNGTKESVPSHLSHLTLSDYLRYERNLTGTKVVCAEGDCGACSVLKINTQTPGPLTAVNSCIHPLVNCHGNHIVTVEALAQKEKLHPSQKAMIDCHGSQCGFCTPGFVVALAGLCEKKKVEGEKLIKAAEVKNALTGNLCRCTGYESIIEAGVEMDPLAQASLTERYHTPEVQADLNKITARPMEINSSKFSFYAPKKLEDAQKYLAQNSDCQIVAGATDLGVVYNKRFDRPKKLLSLHLISECYRLEQKQGRVFVGAQVTLSALRNFLKKDFPEYSHYLDVFASPLIKNNSTLIGNIQTASPIGDNAPVMLTTDALVHLYNGTQAREVALKDYFKSYRVTEKRPEELITGISFQIPSNKYYKIEKVCVRKDMDISIVNMAVAIENQNGTISSIEIALGGVAATPIRLKKTEAFLKNKKIDDSVLENALKMAQTEFTPLSDHRASAGYRRTLVHNLLKHHLDTGAAV